MFIDRVLVVVVGFLFCSLCDVGQAATLTLAPATSSVPVGSPVNVTLAISGLGGGVPPALGSFDVTVQYDPAVLSFNGASFGDPVLGDQLNLSGFGTVSSITPASGSAELFELSLDDVNTLNGLQKSTFILAEINVLAIGAGPGSLSTMQDILSDANGNALSAAVDTSDVTVTAVPEPAYWILILGSAAVLTTYQVHRVRRRVNRA